MLNYKEYIYAVYQEGSFSKAAQKLYVSQPWLSSVVKKVEQEIKTPIFDRSTTPISLTPAGQYYIQQVEKVMNIEEDMRVPTSPSSTARKRNCILEVPCSSARMCFPGCFRNSGRKIPKLP